MRILLVFFLLTVGLSAAAGDLNGTVTDANGEPLMFFNVLLKDTADVLIKAEVTDEQGRFRISGILPGDYRLEISGIGYETLRRELQLGRENTDLGVLQLQPAAETLEEVTVTAIKPIIQVEPDKTVFNVEGNLTTTGDSGFELLRKAPGVVIDNNDNLIVEGKSGVQIFINGRQSALRGTDLTSYLRSLQASDIEAIEIITQPSSRYDAAGNAGIINIRLRRARGMGMQGSANLGLTYGDFGRGNGSVRLNHRSQKLNVYGSASGYLGTRYNFLYLNRTQSGINLDARTDTEIEGRNLNLRGGADYLISDQQTLGLILEGYAGGYESRASSRTPVRPVGQALPDSILVAPNLFEGQSSSFSSNLNYVYEKEGGSRLNIDLDYVRYDSERDNYQPNFYFGPDERQLLSQSISSQISPTDIRILSGRIDYERSLLGGTVAVGAKVSEVQTGNTFSFFRIEDEQPIPDPTRSNAFQYDERVNAGYVNYRTSAGDWKVQAGLRVENTVSSGILTAAVSTDNEQVDRNYTNWFPSGGLTWQAAADHSLALIYSRRIERPDYQSLNPFRYPLDELSFRQGNPFLQPQYTDNVKLSHTFRYTLTTSLSYSYVSDFFAQVTQEAGQKSNFIITRNVADQQVYNISVSYPFSPASWWSVYANVYAYHAAFTANDPAFLAIDRSTFGFYAQNTFRLPKGISLEVSGWYLSPSIWGGTYQTDALGSLNLGLQKKFGESWSANLAVNDVLFTSFWTADTRYANISIDGTGGNDSRQVSLSLNYNFGHSDVKAQRKRETGLEEERNRIGE